MIVLEIFLAEIIVQDIDGQSDLAKNCWDILENEGPIAVSHKEANIIKIFFKNFQAVYERMLGTISVEEIELWKLEKLMVLLAFIRSCKNEFSLSAK